jgi:hypothetical protein
MESPKHPATPKKANRGLLPFWFAFAPNALVIALSLPFYFVPAGDEIRPMGWASTCSTIAFFSLIVIPPFAVSCMIQHRRFLWPLFSIFLALSPFPLAYFFLHNAAYTKGFTLEE